MELQHNNVISIVQSTILKIHEGGFAQSTIEKLFQKPLLDSADLAVIFQRSARTIRRWRNGNEINYTKIGKSRYYLWEDVIAKLNLPDKAA